MSKNFGKCFGPSTRDLSFRLRCPSFLLSKFASQLKLIQSVVRVGILGICVTSSVLRVLLSGSWVSGSQVPSPKDPVLGSWVSGSCVSVSRSPSVPGSGSQGPRVPVFESQGSQSLVCQGPGVSGRGSRVSGPDFRLYPNYTNVIKSLQMTLNSKHRIEKLKTKNQRYRNTKNQNTERRKPSFTKRIGAKCRLI